MPILYTFLSVADSINDLVQNGLEFLEKGFGVTAQSMLVQLLATLVLFLAVKYLLWDKITDILEKRKSAIEESFKAKDEALLESVKASEEAQKMRQDAKAEASTIIENAKKRSYVEADKIINDANIEAKSRIENAEEEINSMKNKAQDDIKNEIVDIACLMAEKIVEKEVDKKKYSKLVEQTINEAGGNNGK